MYTQSVLRESQPNDTDETPGDAQEEIRLPKALIENGATILESLVEVQSAIRRYFIFFRYLFRRHSVPKRWQDESIGRHFHNQCQVADNASDARSHQPHQWFLRMKRQLEESDKTLKCISRERGRSLDLGQGSI